MSEGELMVNEGELMVIFVVDLMVNFGRQRLTRVSFLRPRMSPLWRPHEEEMARLLNRVWVVLWEG